MWNKKRVLVYAACACSCLAQVSPPSYTVQTLAGSAPAGDGVSAVNSVLRFPNAIAFDANGNLYIADQGNASVRVVNKLTGNISSIAGTCVSGFGGDGGPATAAQLSGTISGLAFDNLGNLYLSDSGNRRVREITKDGRINTVFSSANIPGSGVASFWPNGLAFDNQGNLYVADGYNRQVYVMAQSGAVTVFAGNGQAGNTGDDGPASAASLIQPFGLFADNSGAVYIADRWAHRIRKVTVDGKIHAFAGTGQFGVSGDGGLALTAQLAEPMHIVGDNAGNMYIADHSLASRSIRRVAPDGSISTFAGGPNPNGMMGGDGGPAAVALIQQAAGIAVSSTGDVYFSDSDSAVRVVSQGTIDTFAGYRHLAGQYNAAATALLAEPGEIAVDSQDNVYFADANNFRVRQVGEWDAVGGHKKRPVEIDLPNYIWTVAGTGSYGLTGDSGLATSASLTRPLSVASDLNQNIYVGLEGAVRMIGLNGLITTLAGGPLASTVLGKVEGIAVDSSGAVFFSDTDHNVIRKITLGGLVSTIAGTGVAGNAGDGGPAALAQMNSPAALAIDAAGNLFFADTGNSRVRKIRPDGTIMAFAGTGQSGESGDGGPSIAAQLASPLGVAVDKVSNIYIADSASGLVRMVTADGLIHTIAGSGPDPSNIGFSGDNGPALGAKFNGPASIAVDSAGKIYVTDQQNERIRILVPAASN